LLGLRLLLLALLLLIVLRPVLAFTIEERVRRQFATLVDASASMKIQDPRFEAADLARAAMAAGVIDWRKGVQQPLGVGLATKYRSVPRIEVLRNALKDEDLALLPTLAREYDASHFTFGQTLAEIGSGDANSLAWVDQIEPKSQTTALGDAVRELLERRREQSWHRADRSSTPGACRRRPALHLRRRHHLAARHHRRESLHAGCGIREG
jgi:hypothetical protein